MNQQHHDAELLQEAQVLRALLFAEAPPATRADPRHVAAYRRLLVDRVLYERHVGVGSLSDCFPLTLAAWHQAHPEDGGSRRLAACFLASRTYQTAGGRDRPGIEEAFGRYALAEHVAAAVVVKREMIRSVLTAFAAIAPARPRFSLPHEVVRRASGALVAVLYDEGGHAELLALTWRDSGPHLLGGPLTSRLARALLDPGSPASPAVAAALAARGL